MLLTENQKILGPIFLKELTQFVIDQFVRAMKQ